MTQQQYITKRKLNILDFAEQLGNISEACTAKKVLSKPTMVRNGAIISIDFLELVWHESKQFLLVTTRKMRVSPSESVCRSRLQTTLSCCAKESWC